MDPLGFEMIGIVTLTPPVLFVVQTQKKSKSVPNSKRSQIYT